MRHFWVILVLVGCGAVERSSPDAQRSFIDAPRTSDASIDSPAADAPAPDAPSGHVVPANPTLWLKMDDSPTDGALDSAAQPHTATCTACPTLVTAEIGSGYQFTTHRLDVAGTSDLGPNNGFTVAAWVRLDAANSGVTVIACKNQGTLDCSYGLLVETGGTIGYYTPSQHLMGTTVLAVGSWHHLAMTWDGQTKTGYLDGVKEGNVAIASILNDATAPLSIGERNSSTSPLPFVGTVDEVVLYSRVLTQTELAGLAHPP